jgi:glycosyltransferase involved in cell wall biosynthesis
MERVKVLHLITHLGVGGALDNTLLTIKGLARDRYEVHLAAGELMPADDYTDWKARAEASADALFLFPDLCRPINPLRDLRALRQLTDLIQEQNYHIVHTHCAKAGILGRIAARRAGVPVIIHTFHSFAWQVAHAFYPSAWQRGLSFVKKQLYVAMERYAASLSDALIAVSELNKQEALARHIAPSAKKFATIYSGIDLDRFFSFSASREKVCRKFGLDPRRPIVGMIGRLSTQKAPLDFVAAAKIVLQNKPEAQFVIVGDGPLASAVQKAIGAEKRIMLLGFQKNVPEILSILDIFALASLWEGLGRALTEAMSMGIPVAATAVNGVPELVVHEETGLLSPPKNPEQLAANLAWLLDHPKAARQMGKSAQERVLPLFGAEQMVAQIEELYERLLIMKGVRSPNLRRRLKSQATPVGLKSGSRLKATRYRLGVSRLQ